MCVCVRFMFGVIVSDAYTRPRFASADMVSVEAFSLHACATWALVCISDLCHACIHPRHLSAFSIFHMCSSTWLLSGKTPVWDGGCVGRTTAMAVFLRWASLLSVTTR